MARNEIEGDLIELVEKYIDPYIDRSKVEIDKFKRNLKIKQDQQEIKIREGRNCFLGLLYSDKNDKNIRSSLFKQADGPEGIMFGTEAGTNNLIIGTQLRGESGLVKKHLTKKGSLMVTMKDVLKNPADKNMLFSVLCECSTVAPFEKGLKCKGSSWTTAENIYKP